MKRIKRIYQAWTAKDKLLHFVAGTLLYIFFTNIIGQEWAMGLTILIALLKEALWDFILKKGNPEMADFIMTILPVLLMYFFV